MTLSENTAGRPDVLAEWGLSILIESCRPPYFDGWRGGRIGTVKNAELLGIDLTQIDTIVLSHGHFDHTGGLQLLLAAIGHEVPIIAHPDIFAPKYNHSKGHQRPLYRYPLLPVKNWKAWGPNLPFPVNRCISLTKSVTSGEIAYDY